MFGAEEPGRWLELYSAGEAADVTALDTRGSALTSLNSDDYGTCDFSNFPNISVAVIYGGPSGR